METQKIKLKKPIVLRIIFILNGILMLLPFGFYYALSNKILDIPGLNPNLMLYTAGGYILSFAFMVFCISTKRYLGFKLAFLLTFLISLPTQAYIGIFIALISFALSFNKKVKAFFKQ